MELKTKQMSEKAEPNGAVSSAEASSKKKGFRSVESHCLGRLSALSRLLYGEFCGKFCARPKNQREWSQEIQLLALAIFVCLEGQNSEQSTEAGEQTSAQRKEQGQLWFRISELRAVLLSSGCNDTEEWDAFCQLPNFLALLEQSGFYLCSSFGSDAASAGVQSGSAFFWAMREASHDLGQSSQVNKAEKAELCFSLARFGLLQLQIGQQLFRRTAKGSGASASAANPSAASDHDFWNEELLLRAVAEFRGWKEFSPPAELLQECLKKLCSSRLLLIAGGPGSGKTTLLASLLGILRQAERINKAERLQVKKLEGQQNLQIALSAPTARAAQRMLESLRTELSSPEASDAASDAPAVEAQTLHKLLSIGWSRAELYRAACPSLRRKSKARKLAKLDLLVIDEASMLDSEMALELLSSMHPNTRLVLIGDPNQLPAVGLGAFWQELLSGVSLNQLPQNSFAQNLVQLEGSHRFTGEIQTLAEHILHGKRDDFVATIRAAQVAAQSVEGGKIVTWQQQASGNWAAYLWQHWLLKGFPKEFLQEQRLSQRKQPEKIKLLFDWMREYSILTPLQKSHWGAGYLNQSLLASQQAGRRTYGGFFHGCPLQITKNTYALRLYNGDRGFCLQIGSQFYGTFESEAKNESEAAPYRFFPMSQLSDCEASFIQSIHKSQGSEYQNVCIVLPEFDAEQNIWSRALLYTAVTRAKQKLCFVGSEAGLQSVAAVLTAQGARTAPSLLTALLRSA